MDIKARYSAAQFFGTGIYLFLFCSIAFAEKTPVNHPPSEFALFEEVPTVFSASKIEEPLLEAPAAMTVITSEDLKNWGIVDLPDAFRFVPGMDVTAFSGREWSVTARGFNERFASKMLVLIDGMSIYTPLFSGVIWSALPVSIEDIDRIEIVRGPNDTLYGFNAFNGVINIITKDAKDAQGVLGKYTYGSNDRDEMTGRYGDTVDFEEMGHLDFRTTYGFNQNEGYGDNNGDGYTDSRHLNQSSGRARYTYNEHLNIEAMYGVSTGPNETAATTVTGPSFKRREDMVYDIARINFKQNEVHSGSLQFDHWWLDRDAEIQTNGLSTSDHEEEQFNIDFEDHISLDEDRSHTVWGVSYRHSAVRSLLVNRDLTDNALQPSTDDLFSFFANEKWTLLENKPYIKKLTAVAGLRGEGSEFIDGLRWAPRASLLYEPIQDHIFRLTYARAYRLPSFIDELGTNLVPQNTGTIQRILGNSKLKTETVDSYEAGYSNSLFDHKLQLDADLFLANYSGLLKAVETQTFIGGASGQPGIISFNNSRSAQSQGVELAGAYRPTREFNTFTNYTYEYITDSNDSASASPYEGVTPRNKASLGGNYRFYKDTFSAMSLLDGLSLSITMNYRDSHINYSPNQSRVKHHIWTNLRISKSFFEDSLEAAFIAQNITGRRHFEANTVEVPQLFFLTVTMRSWPWDFWKPESERTKGLIQSYQTHKGTK